MNKNEKQQLASQKDIPILTRTSILYGDSTTLRSLVLLIPALGSPIDLILSKNGQEFTIKRIEIFLEELKARLDTVENSAINSSDEEALFDLMQTAFENVVRTRSENKIKRFARLTSDCLLNDRSWDETEATIRLISDLTDIHIKILQIALSAPMLTNEAFNGLRVISISNKNNDFDILSLKTSLNYLSEAALKMYCSELISKGLLHDEGIGRWDVGALELLVPTELANWLLEKVDEIAK